MGRKSKKNVKNNTYGKFDRRKNKTRNLQKFSKLPETGSNEPSDTLNLQSDTFMTSSCISSSSDSIDIVGINDSYSRSQIKPDFKNMCTSCSDTSTNVPQNQDVTLESDIVLADCSNSSSNISKNINKIATGSHSISQNEEFNSDVC